VMHLDSNLLIIINQFGPWAYGIVFTIIFLETTLVLTPFLPGDSLIFAAGTLAGVGAWDVWTLFFLLTVAAVLGDTVNYWIGHYFGERVFMKNRLFKKEYLDKTHQFYEKHGGKTIMLARFIPIIRTFAPFVAGISNMEYFRFLVYNVIGGILWGGIFFFAGYYFGNIDFVKENLTLMVLGVIFVSLIPPIIVILRKNRDKLKWVVHREYFYLILLCFVAFIAFAVIIREVIASNGVIGFDKIVYDSFKAIAAPEMTKVMLFITRIGDTLPMVLMSVLLLVVLLMMKRKMKALIWMQSHRRKELGLLR